MIHKLLAFFLLTSFMQGAFAQTLNDSFAERKLNDKEAKESKEFVHEGVRQEVLKKECSQEALGDCDLSSVNRQGSLIKGSLGENLEQNIGRLYGIMGMATGNKVKVKESSQADKKDATEEFDYCILTAQGYEIISGSLQEGLQSKIAKDLESESDLQMKSLVALKKTHEARAKTSSYQGAIYAATGSCYIARAVASQGKVVLNPGYWIKMSGAFALSGLYLAKVSKHKNAADTVQEVIEKLPGQGDCNPWTKTSCFCAQASSKTTYPALYEQVCVVQRGELNPARVSMACGVVKDGKMTVDKDCKCKQTNSCFRARINPGQIKFKLGANFMNQANRGFELLGRGEFDQGQFDAYSLQSGVYAGKIKDKIAPPSQLKSPSLTPEERATADSLKDILPPMARELVAKATPTTPNGGAMDSAISAATQNLPEKIKEQISKNKVAKYQNRGGGFGGGNNSEPELSFEFPKTSDGDNSAGVEVIELTERALDNNADIRTTTETPLFDIISNRYMRSGWSKLNPEEIK
jgi:hypothetical protein